LYSRHIVGYHHRFGDVSGWYVASEDLWLQRRQRSSRRVARRVHEVRLDGGERGLLGEPGGRTRLQEAGDRQEFSAWTLCARTKPIPDTYDGQRD